EKPSALASPARGGSCRRLMGVARRSGAMEDGVTPIRLRHLSGQPACRPGGIRGLVPAELESPAHPPQAGEGKAVRSRFPRSRGKLPKADGGNAKIGARWEMALPPSGFATFPRKRGKGGRIRLAQGAFSRDV